MKQKYVNPEVEVWELITQSPLCASVVEGGGSIIDELEKDDDFEW